MVFIYKNTLENLSDIMTLEFTIKMNEHGLFDMNVKAIVDSDSNLIPFQYENPDKEFIDCTYTNLDQKGIQKQIEEIIDENKWY
ncbi:hypothetical protein ANME2D_02245 [Candidatus Methanoperedens nitroreducens]|uniref:Uncharacterized protein n=1 Tax=Candidatus Methanoperedens nitratireducens TaxID=1392998 RepID=A0A062V4J2_9EURY|nr:hypothetical protein ANME2D_02245 [Candidatus Methanoperedens nitroreducens]